MLQRHSVRLVGRAQLIVAIPLFLSLATPVAAHEVRQVGEYEIVVGFISEPVFTGQKSGLEFFVNKGETPVEGLEETLVAEVIYGEARRDLPVSPRFGQPGAYQSVFFPTSAGPYTFHISGTIEGNPFDESFTSSEEGFNEVEEATSGQFPVQFPAPVDLAADARSGRDAAAQMPLALGLGAAGTLLGVLGLGIALAGRRRGAA